jgi:hypothetical protein
MSISNSYHVLVLYIYITCTVVVQSISVQLLNNYRIASVYGLEEKWR